MIMVTVLLAKGPGLVTVAELALVTVCVGDSGRVSSGDSVCW